MKQFIIFACLAAILASSAASADQTIAGQATLDNQVRGARDIFVCRCLNAKVKDAPTRAIFSKDITEYICEVMGVAKGSYKVGDTVTYRQRNFRGAPVLNCDGEAETILFLGAENVDGMRTPVGASNGKVDVTVGDDGTRTARIAPVRDELFRNLLVRRPALSKSLGTRNADAVKVTTRQNMAFDDFMAVISGVVKDIEAERRGGK